MFLFPTIFFKPFFQKKQKISMIVGKEFFFFPLYKFTTFSFTTVSDKSHTNLTPYCFFILDWSPLGLFFCPAFGTPDSRDPGQWGLTTPEGP